jgi:predicted cobalt transporter CbtA
MGGTLLLRGMLVGIVAGILCFGFLKVFGEPQVDRAIAFESAMDAAKAHAPGAAAAVEEPELVSRPVQAGWGLFTGVAVYSAAFGGLFALAFAFAYGRISSAGPRAVSALLAGCGFLALYVVPTLKYPANPPSVGEPDTIGMRTALYFGMIVLSLAAMVGAAILRRRLLRRLGAWDASVIAGVVYAVGVAVIMLALPSINEVPDEFPAVVLWQFRVASLGGQALMWAVIGLGFGALTERAATNGRLTRFKAAY